MRKKHVEEESVEDAPAPKKHKHFDVGAVTHVLVEHIREHHAPGHVADLEAKLKEVGWIDPKAVSAE